MEYLIILSKDASVRVMNLGSVVVESGKGDHLRVIMDIKEQFSQLEEEATRPRQTGLR